MNYKHFFCLKHFFHYLYINFYSSSGRRGTGLSSGIGRSGRSNRRATATSGAGHSGQSANSGESLGDDDDDI